MSITEIIRRGFANGDSYAVINKALADAGFNLKLVARDVSGWTSQEMAEGFNEGESKEGVLHLADLMKRHSSLAGTKHTLWCAEGQYEVTYNESGYAVKAVRQNV